MSEKQAIRWSPVKDKQYEAATVGNVMVKLYKRERATATGKHRVIYELSDYTSGKRVLRSFTDLAEARQKADTIARQLASGESTAAAMNNADAASFGRAVQILRDAGITMPLELVAAHFAESFTITGGDKSIEAAKFFVRHNPDQLEQRSVADTITELVALKKTRGMSDDYTNDLRQRLTRFAKDNSVDISSVTTGDVQRWLDGLKLGSQSVKNFRTVLHTLFEFAEARGYIIKGSNPVADTESVKVKGGAIQIFTTDEIAKLLKHASKDFLPMVAIGAFAGLRSAEVERIEWRDVDTKGGFITVASDKAKTKARRLVPISANLAAWLADYTNNTGTVWKGTANDLCDARMTCVKAAGVTWKDNGLRHSFASYRLAETQNAAQVALEMGNSADVVFKHYRELVKPDMAKAWFSIKPEPKATK